MRMKLTALLAGVLLLLLAVPAWAAAHTYVGTATATGLEFTIEDEGATMGFSEAAVQSAAAPDGCGSTRGNACARGAGAPVLGRTAEAHQPNGLDDAVVPALALPDTFPLLSGNIGAGRAAAEIDGDDRSATGEGGATTLSLTMTEELGQSEEVQIALVAISTALIGPIEQGDPTGLGGRLKTAVDQLRDEPTAAPLVTFAGSPSESAAGDVAGVTTATATAEGATIVVAPTAESLLPDAPEGLIIIEIGEAVATATSNQRTAQASYTAAPVELRVFDPVTLDYTVTELEPGESGCAAEGTPLETCVVAGGGQQTVEGAGSAAAAAGVAVSTLAEPLPDLTLLLAQAEAAVASAPPAPAPSPAPVPAPVPSPSPSPSPAAPVARPAANLPRTGADVTLPALGLISLGALGWVGSRRRD